MESQDIELPLATRLRGQHLRIPSFHDLFARWPSRLSPQHEEIKEFINEKLDEWIEDPRLRLKAERIDLPTFTSRWWPTASLDAALCAAFYNLWLFVWDDSLDGEDAVRGIADTKELHRQAIAFISSALGPSASDEPAPPAPSQLTAAIFGFVGERLTKTYPEAGRRRFLGEVDFYLHCCDVERAYLNKGVLPSVEEYWAHRRGTSSVYSSAALADFMAGVRIPEDLYRIEEMKTLWNEHNRNISIINDLMSLKKEINVGIHMNLIPITMLETGSSLATTIHDITEQLHNSADAFDRAAADLLALAAGNPPTRSSLEKYIEVLQTNMTGNYYWSLRTARYGVAQYVEMDGSLVIPLW